MKILAVIAGLALALPALADDAVLVAAPAAIAPAEVVAAAQLDPVLDVATVEQAAATDTNALGLSSGVTTGLIFFVVAVTLFQIGTDGDAGN